MKLYELTGLFNQLFDQFDDINNYIPDTDANGRFIGADGEIIDDLEAYRERMLSAWFDTLEGIEGEFNMKAESIAAYMKGLYVEAAAIREEEAILRRRRQSLEKSADRLKLHLLNSMKAIGVKTIDMPRARMTVRKNAASLVVDDELSFISWAQKTLTACSNTPCRRSAKARLRKCYRPGRSFRMSIWSAPRAWSSNRRKYEDIF